MMKRVVLSTALIIIGSVLAILTIGKGFSQAITIEDIDASRRVDWRQAGYPGQIPDIAVNIINVKTAGAVGDGVTDDAGKVQAAIKDAPYPAVIFFPAGTYRMASQLELKSGIVLRGEGSERTRLDFYSDNGCLKIKGSTDGVYTGILDGMQKGSNKLVVADTSGFHVGHGGQIRQEDIEAVDPTGEWASKDWTPHHVVGQMVKIVAIEGNTLTIEPPLHFTFTAAQHPEIIPIDYKRDVGVEDLHIHRANTGTATSNFNITHAADCWIRRVESDYTPKYHFSISNSIHLEIRENYIHDAYSKGNGGRGYGTSLAWYTTSALIENNIFDNLRHSMIIQLGVNGCVFGYNYAQRNYSDDLWDKTYISVHGHYPYMNLFEGNIVGWAGLADYWGASGPGNTLFRNRIIGTDRHQAFGPYRGIWVDDYSHRQNIIGNELTGSQTAISFDGQQDSLQGTSNDVLVHGNNVHGDIGWDAGFNDQILPASFYLKAKPAFFGALPWPSLGPDQLLGTGTIPAKARFDQGAYVPQAGDNAAEDVPQPEDNNGGDNAAEDIPQPEDNGGGDNIQGSGGGGGCLINVLSSCL